MLMLPHEGQDVLFLLLVVRKGRVEVRQEVALSVQSLTTVILLQAILNHL
jgi:hypothetical protein